MRSHACIFASIALALAFPLPGQEAQEPALFAPRRDEKLNAISLELRGKPCEPEKNRMWVDFSRIPAPKSPAEFSSVWHQPAVCQGFSGMCWCFSTTSFLESEVERLSRRKLSFSVLHTVYWEYVEKARGFVQSRGTTAFAEGSQSAAVLRAWRKHGVVPAESYTGLKDGAKNYDHESTLFPELKKYLDGVKAAGAWNEEQVVSTVRAILDFHLGAPPATVRAEGKDLTPVQYLQQVVRLDLDDYVEFLSFMDKPYWQAAEYEVPDNWWHGKEYVNIPLEDFMAAFKGAVRKGYSLAIAIDMSEPGYSIGAPGIAVVPGWDIPASAIDARARQFRFSNGTSTDDHGLHVVGYTRKDGQDWFLVKDSWSSAWNNEHPGYYFFREDYVKLKTLGFMVHKSAVPELLAKVGK